MKTQAVVVDESSESRSLSLTEIELAPPGPGEVLIKVKAAGVNRADLHQRQGKYPLPKGAPATLGLEASGIIEQLGEGVREWQPGDEVFSLLIGGGYAQHAIASAGLLWRKPKEWSFPEAAAIPEGIVTAFLNLVIEGELAIGEHVLIQGGSSGVGTFAVQVARKLGARVTATAGSDERCAKVKELGAHECLNYRRTQPASAGPFDLILDILGAPTVALVNSLNIEGRIVFIATQNGPAAELDLRELMKKRARLIGSMLRARPLEEKIAIKRHLDLVIGEALFSGEIRPVVDSIIPLADVEKAHARMKEGAHFGKIVLSV